MTGADDAVARADEVAAQALSFVAGDPVIFNRFLRRTGLELENLRASGSEPAFLADVLDFVMSDDRLVAALSDQSTLRLDALLEARRQLEGDHTSGA